MNNLSKKPYIVREAETRDAAFLGQVVIGALGEGLCTQLAGTKDYQSILSELFGSLAELDNSQYSFRNSFIAETINNSERVGGIIAYDGAEMRRLRKEFLKKAAILLKWDKKEEDLTDETNPGEIYIDSLFVIPGFRRQGIAETLINAVINKYKSGSKPIGLLAEMHNRKALSLYEKVGFEIIEIGDFFGEKMPHLQYNRHLSGD